MSNIIVIVLVLMFVGLCLWGVWHLFKNRATYGVPTVVVGIALILIFLLVALAYIGPRIGASKLSAADAREQITWIRQQ